MKRIKIYFFILVCILLASCRGQYTKNTTILRAEALLNSSPDSAYHLLTSMAHPQDMSKADYAAWCLNYTYAQYKLYIDIKSDSIIRISVNYYDKSNLIKQSGTAYYLLGCVLQMNNKNKDAMWAYKKAEELLYKTNENNLNGLLEFKIGHILIQDELFNQSLEYFRKSQQYFNRSKNQKYQAYAYRAISDMYEKLNYPFDSIMLYSDFALKLSNQMGDSVNSLSILAQQGELLYNRDFERAKHNLLKSYNYLPAQRTYIAAYLSYIYSKTNKSDSAKYYLNIAIDDTTNINSKLTTGIARAYIAKNQGEQNKAFDYLVNAYSLRESIFQQSIHSQLYRIDKQFDLTKREEENARLKISNQRKVIMIGVLIIFLLVLSFGILYVIDVHKKKMLKIDTLNQIQRQKMKYDLMLKQAENKQTQQLLLVKLQNRINNTLFYNKLNMSYGLVDKKEEFEKIMIEQSVLTETDWKFYIEEVNHLFDRKIDLFASTYPGLSQLDLIVITLIALQIDISDSCSLLNMNKTTMYKRRNRIKERIGLEKDINLEDWLAVYLDSEVVEEEVI